MAVSPACLGEQKHTGAREREDGRGGAGWGGAGGGRGDGSGGCCYEAIRDELAIVHKQIRNF